MAIVLNVIKGQQVKALAKHFLCYQLILEGNFALPPTACAQFDQCLNPRVEESLGPFGNRSNSLCASDLQLCGEQSSAEVNSSSEAEVSLLQRDKNCISVTHFGV